MVKPAPPPTYVSVLAELAALQDYVEHLKRLETYVLRLMHEAGITDDAIGIEQNISSQAVGKKRRRRINSGWRPA